MAPDRGSLGLVQQLAEITHLEHVTKHATRQLEDLATVRDAEQRLHVSRLPQGAVIDRCHHGFARASAGDHQVSMPPERARPRLAPLYRHQKTRFDFLQGRRTPCRFLLKSLA
jgi:hypothetical protein